MLSCSKPERSSPLVGGVPASVRFGEAVVSRGVQTQVGAASADPRLDLATSPGPLRLPGQPSLSPFAFELALAVAPRSHARSLLTHWPVPPH